MDTKRWTVWEVASTVAEGLNWPHYSLERKTELLIERHFLGDFITGHPLWHYPVPDDVEMVGELVRREELTREREQNGIPA